MHQWLGQRGDTNFALLGRLSAHSATSSTSVALIAGMDDDAADTTEEQRRNRPAGLR